VGRLALGSSSDHSRVRARGRAPVHDGPHGARRLPSRVHLKS